MKNGIISMFVGITISMVITPALAEIYCLGECASTYRGFCKGTTDNWCNPDSGVTHSEFPYCILNGGRLIGDSEEDWVVCFGTEKECMGVKDGIIKKTSANQEVAVYALCNDRGITDYYDDISCCAAGKYSTTDYGCGNRYSTVGSVSCKNCPTGYYSEIASTSCTQCPQATDIYTNSTRTTLARGTVPSGSGTSAEACYLPIGTYYDKNGSFDIGSNMCTY